MFKPYIIIVVLCLTIFFAALFTYLSKELNLTNFFSYCIINILVAVIIFPVFWLLAWVNISEDATYITSFEVTSKIELVSKNNGETYLERDENNSCFIYNYINPLTGHLITKKISFKEALIIPVDDVDKGYIYVIANEGKQHVSSPGNWFIKPYEKDIASPDSKEYIIFVIPSYTIKSYVPSMSIEE